MVNPQTNIAMNVTNSLNSLNGMSGMDSWFSSMVIVAITSVLILFLVIALSNITRYKKIKGVLSWLLNTVKFFFFGIGGIGVLSVFGLILFYFGNQAKQGNVVPIKITLLIIAGYFVIAGLGYLLKRFVLDRIKLFEEELDQCKEVKENGYFL